MKRCETLRYFSNILSIRRAMLGTTTLLPIVLLAISTLLASEVYANEENCGYADYYLRVNGQPLANATDVAVVNANESVPFTFLWDIWITNPHSSPVTHISWNDSLAHFDFGDGTSQDITFNLKVTHAMPPDPAIPDNFYDSITLCARHVYQEAGEYPIRFHIIPTSNTLCSVFSNPPCQTIPSTEPVNVREGIVRVSSPSCTLSIDVDPPSILPLLPPKQIPVRLADEPDAAEITANVSNCVGRQSVEVTFELQAPKDGAAAAGGHFPSHDPSRDPGTLTRDRCLAVLTPNGTGWCSVRYVPPDVSGTVTINAKAANISTTSAKVNVRVPNLTNLPASSLWRLTGQTANHPNNHLGVPQTIASTQLIAEDFREIIQKTLKLNVTLGINDMNLQYGGLFDIDGFWESPHISHRVGTSVDIDRCACGSWDNDKKKCITNDACQTPVIVSRDLIGQLCNRFGGWLVKEATIHCEFPF